MFLQLLEHVLWFRLGRLFSITESVCVGPIPKASNYLNLGAGNERQGLHPYR